MNFKFSQLSLVCCALFVSMPIYALDTELYGSVRVQLEYVEPDNEAGNFDDYVDLRDAYSRVGLKVHHTFSQQWSALFQLEAPLDVANVDIHGPWDQDEDLRIFKLNLSTPAGDFSYGRGWMPYYNNIAYPVDYFSSYYSGFATFTTFRLDDTLSYTSPLFNGFQFSAATSKDNGANDESRNQFTASYTNNGLSFAAGIDDIGGADDTKIIGLSASYDNGPWYFATKYERFKSALEGSGWAADGTNVFNALVQYTTGKNTLRIMLADSDNYGEFILHAALDVQYSDKITLFLEYYQEQETAAISDRKQTTSYGSNSAPSDSGGRSFVTGIRYDF